MLPVNQTVTNQAPVNRRPRRNRHQPFPLQVIPNRPRTPTPMSPTHLHDPSLHHRRRLMRTSVRLRAPVHQPRQTPRRVTAKPQMHRLTSHPIPPSHINHRDTPQGPPTPPDTAVPQHSAPPTRQDFLREFREGWNQEVSPTYRSHCRPGTGTASTKWNPPTGATMSSINRSRTARPCR